jgi:hypothetical protein
MLIFRETRLSLDVQRENGEDHVGTGEGGEGAVFAGA